MKKWFKSVRRKEFARTSWSTFKIKLFTIYSFGGVRFWRYIIFAKVLKKTFGVRKKPEEITRSQITRRRIFDFQYFGLLEHKVNKMVKIIKGALKLFLGSEKLSVLDDLMKMQSEDSDADLRIGSCAPGGDRCDGGPAPNMKIRLLQDGRSTLSPCYQQPSRHHSTSSNATAPCLESNALPSPPPYKCCNHQCALMTSAHQNTTHYALHQTRPTVPPPYRLWMVRNVFILKTVIPMWILTPQIDFMVYFFLTCQSVNIY